MLVGDRCRVVYFMRFKLRTPAGIYEADTFFMLVIEVLRHRFHHLIHDGKWMD